MRPWPGAVAEVSPRVYELSEFLVDVLGVTDVGASFPHRVAYHPTCHSLRMLGVGDRPRRLLEEVRGLSLVDLPAAEECCGFGGTFAVKNPDVSVAMGADKARHVRETGAEVLVAGDSSCLMHIGGLLSRQQSGVRVMHLAEVLAATATRRRSDVMTHVRRDAGVPGRGTRGAGRHPAAAQPGPRDAHHPRQAGPGRGRGARLGGAPAGRRRPQGRHPGPTSTSTSSSSRPRWSSAAPSCTGRATPPRPARWSPRWPGRTASTRW